MRRQRLARRLRRMALIALRLARTAAAFLWRTAIALSIILRRTATACFAWARPRAYALALTLAAWTLALLAWAATELRLLVRATSRAAASAAASIAHQSQNSRGDGAALADRRLGLDPDRGRAARPRRFCERIDRCSVERGAVAGSGNVAPPRDDSTRLVDAEENRSFLPHVARHRVAGFLLGETGQSARGREPSRARDQAFNGADLIRAAARAPARTQRGRRVTAG